MTKTKPITTTLVANPVGDWWFSADGKRGFCYAAVKGFDYKVADAGRMMATLYLYLDAGICHLTGSEADAVYKLVVGRVKT